MLTGSGKVVTVTMNAVSGDFTLRPMKTALGL
jgi:hypothetical protein